MTIEIKFTATDKSDLFSQLRAYLGEDWIIMDRPKITCSEPISYQEAVNGAIGKEELHVNWNDYRGEMTKAEIRAIITGCMERKPPMDAKAIKEALADWNVDLSLAAIGGIMGGIKRQKEKQEAHYKAVDEKILSMKTCDPLLIADTINRELGGNWTEEKVSRRLKELI